MVEAVRSCVTSVNFYQTTRCYNPEGSHLYVEMDLGGQGQALVI